jgi:hypothetical protein
MKTFPLTVALALACAACASIPSTNLATRVPIATVVAADTAYVAFEKASEIAVRAGKMDLATFHQRNEQAYAVLLKVRAGQSTLEALQAVIGH